MTVERSARARKIGHHQLQPPKACCVIDLNAIAPSARLLMKRMKSNEASRGCGSYLYVEPNGSAYIVSDDAGIALDWIKSRIAWLVGFYTKFGNEHRGLAPTLDGIIEDLREHFATSAPDARISVGYQQEGVGIGLQPATGVGSLSRSEAAATAEGDNSASGGGAFILEFKR